MLSNQTLAHLKQLDKVRKQLLRSVMRDLRYTSWGDLIADLHQMEAEDRRLKHHSNSKALGKNHPAKRKRSHITPEMRAAVAQRVREGLSAPMAAKEFGIAVNTVQNIKSEFGLVKKQKA